MLRMSQPLDMQRHPIVRIVLHRSGGAPPAPAEGQVYYDIFCKTVFYYNGTAWIAIGSGDIGPQGADGSMIMSGSGAPAAEDGDDGDFYIDLDTYDFYGPKLAGSWGSGVSLVGPPGSGDLSYAHIQGSAAATWNVTHNLGRYPSVVITDSAGNVVHGNIEHLNANTTRLTFSAGFAGRADFN